MLITKFFTVQLNQRDLMNGSLKTEMTRWWLDVIDTEVDKFMAEGMCACVGVVWGGKAHISFC